MDFRAPLSRSNNLEWANDPQNGNPSPSSPLYRRLFRLDVLEVFTSIFVPTMAESEYLIFDEKEAF